MQTSKQAPDAQEARFRAYALAYRCQAGACAASRLLAALLAAADDRASRQGLHALVRSALADLPTRH